MFYVHFCDLLHGALQARTSGVPGLRVFIGLFETRGRFGSSRKPLGIRR